MKEADLKIMDWVEDSKEKKYKCCDSCMHFPQFFEPIAFSEKQKSTWQLKYFKQSSKSLIVPHYREQICVICWEKLNRLIRIPWKQLNIQ